MAKKIFNWNEILGIQELQAMKKIVDDMFNQLKKQALDRDWETN